MALATVEDVEARFHRELTEDEKRLVAARLDDAELILRSRVPDLLQRVEDGDIDRDIVVMIEVDMILRIIRNPEGLSQETDGNYSYSVSARAGSGILEALPSEWALLGVGSGAFTIGPRIRRYRPYPCHWATL